MLLSPWVRNKTKQRAAPVQKRALVAEGGGRGRRRPSRGWHVKRAGSSPNFFLVVHYLRDCKTVLAEERSERNRVPRRDQCLCIIYMLSAYCSAKNVIPARRSLPLILPPTTTQPTTKHRGGERVRD